MQLQDRAFECVLQFFLSPLLQNYSKHIGTPGLSLQIKAQDIAGSMRADKQNLRMEELDLLFQQPTFG